MSEKKYILAFDQNVRRTGWCLYQPHHVEAMLFGNFDSAPGEDLTTIQKCTIFGDKLIELFEMHRPDFVAWERAADNIRRFAPKKGKDGKPAGAPSFDLSVNASQLILQIIQGQILQMCRVHRIPFVAAHTSSWRAMILKNGKLDGPAAKKEAKRVCQMLRIDAKNHDEAEAACIAIYASHSDTFKKVQAGLIPTRAAA